MPTRVPSLAARATLAVVLLIGFYVLAIAVAAALLFLPYAELRWGHRIHIQLAFLSIVGAVIVIWSMIPKFDRFQAPGPLLTREQHPRLFTILEELAGRVGQEQPAEVYLIHDVNAWVAQRGGAMGLGGRRVMGIGLPVLQTLSISELRAVLAHEFGHFYGGDTKLGAFIYQTRSAIGRTIEGLAATGRSAGALQAPFIAYGNMFMRVMQSVSRAQEMTADELAAEVAGPTPLIEGLKKLHVTAMAYNGYLSSEFSPTVQMGLLPPVGDGFARYIVAPVVRGEMDRLLQGIVESERKDSEEADATVRRYESHPRLPDRIDAITALGLEDPPLSPAPAITLLEDVPALDAALSKIMLVPKLAAACQAIAWADVGRLGYLKSYQALIAVYADCFRGATIGELSQRRDEIVQAVLEKQRADNLGGWNMELEDRKQGALWAIGAAICVALAEHGFEFVSGPGEPVSMRGPGGSIEPAAAVAKLADGATSGEEWRANCATLGIAGIGLPAGSRTL